MSADAPGASGLATIDPSQVTGLILAGGLGRRMSADGQGLDKGLQSFQGAPMIARVIERLAPQVGCLLINANRNRARYETFGHEVIADAIEGYAGPLAGLHAGLGAARTRYLASVPCDSPFLPLDLVRRLAVALAARRAQVAVARTGPQAHPVFMLVDRSVLPGLERFLAGGQRKIDAWYSELALAEVDFEDERAFLNINTIAELRQHEAP
jgi:molybdopterin-guanine dinucleotide biosynthesis protein A